MKAATALLLALALTGCATCERHPVICTTAIGVGMTSLALSVHNTRPGNSASSDEGRIGPPLTPNCTVYPEMCK